MRQTIGNACGTVALLHSLCNNQDIADFAKDSFLETFMTRCKAANPMERADFLYEDALVEQNH